MSAGTSDGVGGGWIGGTIQGALNQIGGNIWSGINYDTQVALNKEVMNREDSAMQRRVRDLKLAGLSPVLATGQGAGSGGTVTTPAGQFTEGKVDPLLKISEMKGQVDISRTLSEKKLVDAKIDEQVMENAYLRQGARSPKNQGGLSKSLEDIVNTLTKNGKSGIKEKIKSSVDPYVQSLLDNKAVHKLIDKMKGAGVEMADPLTPDEKSQKRIDKNTSDFNKRYGD